MVNLTLHKTTKNGRVAWQWGDGTKFVGAFGKQRAIDQGKTKLFEEAKSQGLEGKAAVNWVQKQTAVSAAEYRDITDTIQNQPEARYIWHTCKDSRVRDKHADREGQVFLWSDPPSGGHPGFDYRCRCWSEPVEGTTMALHPREESM